MLYSNPTCFGSWNFRKAESGDDQTVIGVPRRTDIAISVGSLVLGEGTDAALIGATDVGCVFAVSVPWHPTTINPNNTKPTPLLITSLHAYDTVPTATAWRFDLEFVTYCLSQHAFTQRRAD